MRVSAAWYQLPPHTLDSKHFPEHLHCYQRLHPQLSGETISSIQSQSQSNCDWSHSILCSAYISSSLVFFYIVGTLKTLHKHCHKILVVNVCFSLRIIIQMIYQPFCIQNINFLSSQGLVISIIFCLANEEVQNVLRTHWKRRMMVRMVKKEGRMRSISMRNRKVIKNSEII